MDAQTIVETLAASDDTSALAVIQAIIQSRPELASPLVNFIIPDLTYPPAKALTEKRSRGTIKHLNVEKGYGFIECQELHAVTGADVFIHHKQSAGFTVGQEISFAVMLNKANKLQAYDVSSADEKGGGKGKSKGKGGGATDPFSAMMQAMDSSSGGGSEEELLQQVLMTMMGKGGKGGKGNFSGEKGNFSGEKGQGKGEWKEPTKGKPNEVETLGEFQGVIKSFAAKSGYGFIECQDLRDVGCPNDVFLHHMQLNGFEVGSHVQFTAYMNRNGQPQAKDLQASQGGAKKFKAW